MVDAQGNPVPGAIISSRNALFSVDSSGHRLFENLSPGRFFARVDARGFTSATSVLELQAGAHAGTQVRLLPRPAPLPFQAEQGGILQTEQGLSICQRIVTSFGGRMELQSEVGRGSIFRVILPAATVGVSMATAQAPEPDTMPRRGRILVVDDEPMVGTAIRRALQKEHEVLALTSAREAQARLAGRELFDVILCDIMMPEMSGMDLHA